MLWVRFRYCLSYQRQIGKALVWEGLARLKALGAKGVLLGGAPPNTTEVGFL